MDKKTKAVLMLREKKIEAWCTGFYIYVHVNNLTIKLAEEEINRLSNMWDGLDF